MTVKEVGVGVAERWSRRRRGIKKNIPWTVKSKKKRGRMGENRPSRSRLGFWRPGLRMEACRRRALWLLQIKWVADEALSGNGVWAEFWSQWCRFWLRGPQNPGQRGLK